MSVNKAYNVRGDGACFYRSLGLGLQCLELKNYLPKKGVLDKARFEMTVEQIREMKLTGLKEIENADLSLLLFAVGEVAEEERKEIKKQEDALKKWGLLELIPKPGDPNHVKSLRENLDYVKENIEQLGVAASKQVLVGYLQDSIFMNNDYEVHNWIMPYLASYNSVRIHTFVAVAGTFPADGEKFVVTYTGEEYNKFGLDSKERQGKKAVYLVSSSTTGGHWSYLSFAQDPGQMKRDDKFTFTYMDKVKRFHQHTRMCSRCGLLKT